MACSSADILLRYEASEVFRATPPFTAACRGSLHDYVLHFIHLVCWLKTPEFKDKEVWTNIVRYI